MSELSKEKLAKLDEFTRNFNEFKKLWKLIEDKKGHTFNWSEWKTPYRFGIHSSLGSVDEVLRNKLVEYCGGLLDVDSMGLIEDYPSCVGSFDTDYPLIFVANNVNGRMIGDWIAPHTFSDYWSFMTAVDIETGEVNCTSPLIICSINLPEEFEDNRNSDSLFSNIWLYSIDLYEEEPEDRHDVSDYAEGGIG